MQLKTIVIVAVIGIALLPTYPREEFKNMCNSLSGNKFEAKEIITMKGYCYHFNKVDSTMGTVPCTENIINEHILENDWIHINESNQVDNTWTCIIKKNNGTIMSEMYFFEG